MEGRSPSDIVFFLEALESDPEFRDVLLSEHYSGVAEFWEAYDLAKLELQEIAPVLELMRMHDTTWHELDEVRWLAGLVEEVGELAASMMDRHDDPIAWEMMQIATIAINFLRLYSTGNVMKLLLHQHQGKPED